MGDYIGEGEGDGEGEGGVCWSLGGCAGVEDTINMNATCGTCFSYL